MTNKKAVSATKWYVLVLFILAINCYGAPKFVPFGINFSPYINGQTPLPGTLIVKPVQVENRLKGIRGYSQWIRTFSTTHGMENAGAIAHKLNFHTAIGAWIGPENDAGGIGKASNEREILELIAAANRGEVDIALVGNEVLLRNDISAQQLIEYMRLVRSSIPEHIPVTTVEIYSFLIANPTVLADCDIVMANFYPYWEGIRIDEAVSTLDRQYRDLVQKCASKEVWIAETGWPSAGDTISQATPSQKNAAYYFLAFNSWARVNNVNSFYFEAYDEAWKAQSEGPQGAHWGIRNSLGKIKPGMSSVFQNRILPVQAFMRQMSPSDLPGSITIQLTRIPAYGSSQGIDGRVTGIRTSRYTIATYIDVYGGWWTKPYWSQPTVSIRADGTFHVNTVTGGYDSHAQAFMVFLIPSDYSPPAAGGGPIPGDIYAHAVASTYVSRPVGYPGSYNDMPQPTVRSMLIQRSFKGTNGIDTVRISGTIPIENKKALGANVSIQVGSIKWTLAPINRGKAIVIGGDLAKSSGSITITAGQKNWTYSAILKCESDNTDWTEHGLLDETIYSPGIPIFMPVTVSVEEEPYGRIVTGFYTAKAGSIGYMTGNAK